MFQFYWGGISEGMGCDAKEINHGVTLVGFGVGESKKEAGKKFWTVKNSWGTWWGEKGYFRMLRGTGQCGINSLVSTATGIELIQPNTDVRRPKIDAPGERSSDIWI